jgi:hypothetical protein
MPAPTTFLRELRTAHAVFVAYHKGGLRSLPNICLAAHVSRSEATYWLNAFGLPFAYSQLPETPMRETPTFTAFNALT